LEELSLKANLEEEGIIKGRLFFKEGLGEVRFNKL